MFSSKFGRDPAGLHPQWERLLALRGEGHAVLDLTVSNPTAVGLPYPPEIPSLLAEPGLLRYEPSPQGDARARAALCGHYRERNRSCAPDDLFLTASTSEAYSHLFKLLCDPGDEVLIPSPTYPLFDALAELENVQLVRYPLRWRAAAGEAPRWRSDLGFLRNLISTRSKALILVNPNNPTGHLAEAGEIRAYLELAAEYDLALIVDEVFSEYALGDRPCLSIDSQGPLVFSLNGFSKLMGLPQLKLAWIHVAGAPEAAARAKSHLEWIADAFLSVNTPVQGACGALLARGPAIRSAIMARLKANLAAARTLAGTGGALRLLPPEAGWSLILEADGPADDQDFALTLLASRRVYAHPGHLFGFETGCRLVVSLLTPEEDFREGLLRILAHAEEHARS